MLTHWSYISFALTHQTYCMGYTIYMGPLLLTFLHPFLSHWEHSEAIVWKTNAAFYSVAYLHKRWNMIGCGGRPERRDLHYIPWNMLSLHPIKFVHGLCFLLLCCYSDLTRLFNLTAKKNETSHYWPCVRVNHHLPVDSPHKGPVTKKLCSCHDISMLAVPTKCLGMNCNFPTMARYICDKPII